jgi:hypothetical protein
MNCLVFVVGNSTTTMPPAKKKRKGANKKAQDIDDQGAVRRSSPGLGDRKDEPEHSFSSLRATYLLKTTDVMEFRAIAANKADPKVPLVDKTSPEYIAASNLEYSCWWRTASVALPTRIHFPYQDTNDPYDELKAGTTGLIRPVNEVQVQKVREAFAELGNIFDADKPVRTQAHIVVVCVTYRTGWLVG